MPEVSESNHVVRINIYKPTKKRNLSNNVVMCKQLLLQWTNSVCVVASN